MERPVQVRDDGVPVNSAPARRQAEAVSGFHLFATAGGLKSSGPSKAALTTLEALYDLLPSDVLS
eukprot:CAMPEP_0119385588 /NCGR_PEP_ID=MMETSP1334-20130426/91904_1 /TAXON_ID=127549 /ORGANISM="Calcidiscus leptoporus, Strain RCC1130" /LENGTH=64 /DNA_ID=CAMNT_0007406899 /DNA_START=121 /DNA_END=312 /DNA_ORIENTATION=-